MKLTPLVKGTTFTGFVDAAGFNNYIRTRGGHLSSFGSQSTRARRDDI